MSSPEDGEAALTETGIRNALSNVGINDENLVKSLAKNEDSLKELIQYSPFLTDTVIAEMTCVGSVIIMGLALNMLGITKLKVMNYVPAVFVPIILCRFM